MKWGEHFSSQIPSFEKTFDLIKTVWLFSHLRDFFTSLALPNNRETQTQFAVQLKCLQGLFSSRAAKNHSRWSSCFMVWNTFTAMGDVVGTCWNSFNQSFQVSFSSSLASQKIWPFLLAAVCSWEWRFLWEQRKMRGEDCERLAKAQTSITTIQTTTEEEPSCLSLLSFCLMASSAEMNENRSLIYDILRYFDLRSPRELKRSRCSKDHCRGRTHPSSLSGVDSIDASQSPIAIRLELLSSGAHFFWRFICHCFAFLCVLSGNLWPIWHILTYSHLVCDVEPGIAVGSGTAHRVGWRWSWRWCVGGEAGDRASYDFDDSATRKRTRRMRTKKEEQELDVDIKSSDPHLAGGKELTTCFCRKADDRVEGQNDRESQRITENDKECKDPKNITSDLVGCLAKDCLNGSAMFGLMVLRSAEWCQILYSFSILDDAWGRNVVDIAKWKKACMQPQPEGRTCPHP